MNTAAIEEIENSFHDFFETSRRALEIKTEGDYEFALESLDYLMTKAEDHKGEPLLHLIDLIAASIETYEESLENVRTFIQEVESIDPAVSTLRVLIDQHNLRYSDLQEEIGSKSLISQILSGSKKLTRDHISNLSKRFQVSPSLFF